MDQLSDGSEFEMTSIQNRFNVCFEDLRRDDQHISVVYTNYFKFLFVIARKYAIKYILSQFNPMNQIFLFRFSSVETVDVRLARRAQNQNTENSNSIPLNYKRSRVHVHHAQLGNVHNSH